MGAAAYRLHELGWLGFERLCRVLLDDAGVRVTTWERVLGTVARTTAMDGIRSLDLPELSGPTLIVVERLRPERSIEELARVTRPGQSDSWQPHHSLLLLTDAALSPDDVARVEARWRDDLDGAPVALVDGDAAVRSTLDVAAAHALARVFVPTRAHAACVQTLLRHRFAVLTGPPEMGKTAIARMVALARLSAGWEAHECTRPDELWRAFDRTRPQVFVADDAFGSTEYRPEAAERWAVELPRILQAMDDTHWLVWTSRPTPLRAGLRRIHREHGTERFPKPARVQVEAGALDVSEKVLILFRHARAANLPSDARTGVRGHGLDIVWHPDYTPERIRRLTVRLRGFGDQPIVHLSEIVEEVLRRPTEAMTASYHALAPEQRALLLAMLDSPPGAVPERDLARTARRHADGPLQRSPAELVDRLADHFLRVVPPASVAWVHPSWRDLLIDELAGDAAARRAFLTRCGLDGALVAVSVGGGASGERRLPLLRADADWDAITDRLVHVAPELDDLDTSRLLHGLDAAMTDAGDDPELAALGASVLEALRRTWDAGRAPQEVSVLAAWLEAAANLSPRPQPPEVVARTWIELQGDEARVEDFARLALLVQRHLPELYARLAGQHAPALAMERRAAIALEEEWLDEPIARSPDVDPDRRLVRLVLDDLVEAEPG